MNAALVVSSVGGLIAGCSGEREGGSSPSPLVVMTYNIEDVRTVDLLTTGQPRLVAAARVIQRIRPDILLVNELAVDVENLGADADERTNAERFAQDYLAVSHSGDLPGVSYRSYQPGTNTGESSGFDLDNSGRVETVPQEQAPAASDGSPPPQSAAGRLYGNDSWGFGTFPGQYGMAVFVRDGIRIVEEEARTFRLFRWSTLPGAEAPVTPEGQPWYSEEEWSALRLSSKTHAIVPVEVGDGRRISLVISHPTPPAFDGSERRNKLRNRDEIRLIDAILRDEAYAVDDAGRSGGLPAGTPFIVLGDLNADPDEGSSEGDPIGSFLLSNPRVVSGFVPMADSAGVAAFPNLDADDTARFGLRIDYVLPSTDFRIVDGAVHRSADAAVASDHFPVWLELRWAD